MKKISDFVEAFFIKEQEVWNANSSSDLEHFNRLVAQMHEFCEPALHNKLGIIPKDPVLYADPRFAALAHQPEPADYLKRHLFKISEYKRGQEISYLAWTSSSTPDDISKSLPTHCLVIGMNQEGTGYACRDFFWARDYQKGCYCWFSMVRGETVDLVDFGELLQTHRFHVPCKTYYDKALKEFCTAHYEKAI